MKEVTLKFFDKKYVSKWWTGNWSGEGDEASCSTCQSSAMSCDECPYKNK